MVVKQHVHNHMELLVNKGHSKYNLLHSTYDRGSQFFESVHLLLRYNFSKNVNLWIRIKDLYFDRTENQSRVATSVIVVTCQLIVVLRWL